MFRAGGEPRPGRANLFNCDPAAERDRVAAHGTRFAAHDHGCAGALSSDARLSHVLAAGRRSCRHLAAASDGEAIEEGRLDAT